jgi:hypothetical protein
MKYKKRQNLEYQSSRVISRRKIGLNMIKDMKCWTITSLDYVKVAIMNIRETIKINGQQSPSSNIEATLNAM